MGANWMDEEQLLLGQVVRSKYKQGFALRSTTLFTQLCKETKFFHAENVNLGKGEGGGGGSRQDIYVKSPRVMGSWHNNWFRISFIENIIIHYQQVFNFAKKNIFLV